jgi:glycosyltransferase involved in cell wall biosynthesis
MACARPVAAYQGGSVQEVVGEAGRIVATGDREALTEVVREYVRDSGLRAGLGLSGRRRVAERFSPKASLGQLRILYDALVAGRPVLPRRAEAAAR